LYTHDTTDHVAKFEVDRPRKLGDLALKIKEKKKKPQKKNCRELLFWAA